MRRKRKTNGFLPLVLAGGMATGTAIGYGITKPHIYKPAQQIMLTLKGESSGLEEKIEQTEKEKFVKELSPYMAKMQRWTDGKVMSKERRDELASIIYDSAERYDLPPVVLAGLVAKESSFRNVLGDMKYYHKNPRRANHSEGYVQMRKKTQDMVYKLMKSQGREVPDRKPSSIMSYPQLQLNMSAAYLRYCIDQAGGNLEDGIRRYNAGHASEDKEHKREYAQGVLKYAKTIDLLMDN